MIEAEVRFGSGSSGAGGDDTHHQPDRGYNCFVHNLNPLTNYYFYRPGLIFFLN